MNKIIILFNIRYFLKAEKKKQLEVCDKIMIK